MKYKILNKILKIFEKGNYYRQYILINNGS